MVDSNAVIADEADWDDGLGSREGLERVDELLLLPKVVIDSEDDAVDRNSCDGNCVERVEVDDVEMVVAGVSLG